MADTGMPVLPVSQFEYMLLVIPKASAIFAKPSDKDSSDPADGAPSTPAGGSMPHVTGEFSSLDELRYACGAGGGRVY